MKLQWHIRAYELSFVEDEGIITENGEPSTCIEEIDLPYSRMYWEGKNFIVECDSGESELNRLLQGMIVRLAGYVPLPKGACGDADKPNADLRSVSDLQYKKISYFPFLDVGQNSNVTERVVFENAKLKHFEEPIIGLISESKIGMESHVKFQYEDEGACK